MNWDDMVLVGRVARTHGLRGDVVVNPDTDFVTERFRPGATMWIRTAAGDEQLTVMTVRLQNGRPVIAFEGFSTIDSANRLTGQELRVPEASLQPLGPGQYYEHHLAGCSVVTVGGELIGVVDRVESGAGAARLVVKGARGEVLVPLIEHICREIDVKARRIVVDPPEGLLELNESKRSPR